MTRKKKTEAICEQKLSGQSEMNNIRKSISVFTCSKPIATQSTVWKTVYGDRNTITAECSCECYGRGEIKGRIGRLENLRSSVQ